MVVEILVWILGVILNFGVPMLEFGKGFWLDDEDYPILRIILIIACIFAPFLPAVVFGINIIFYNLKTK